MTYELEFDPRALKEWKKLSPPLKEQLKKKLLRILDQPIIEANKLRALPNCYKIKLRSSGYRLVYQIQNDRLIVLVIAIGKRENLQTYKQAQKRI